MNKPRQKIIVSFGIAALILSGLCQAQGQIRVYNPGIYNRTRTTMSNRASGAQKSPPARRGAKSRAETPESSYKAAVNSALKSR